MEDVRRLTEREQREVETAAPGHAAAVRRLFIDHLTPAQLDAVGDAADAVLVSLDQFEAREAPEPGATSR